MSRSGPTTLARIAIMKALTVMSSGCSISSVRQRRCIFRLERSAVLFQQGPGAF